MTPPPLLESVAAVAILVSLGCAAWIAFDLVRRPQKMWVMNLVWPLTALYAGPLGVWAYVTLGRGRQAEDKPLWRTSLTGATHCGAGCAVGDFIGDWVVFLAGFTLLGSDLFAKYAWAFGLAYAAGIFFQFFSIAPMRDLGVREGLWAAVKADTLSLAAYEVGMFAWMALTQLVLLPGLQPVTFSYWFMMQIAMLAGLLTTWPVNAWLIRRGLKEAM